MPGSFFFVLLAFAFLPRADRAVSDFFGFASARMFAIAENTVLIAETKPRTGAKSKNTRVNEQSR